MKTRDLKLKVVDGRGDEVVIEKVSSIDFINRNICYINEYNEEEVVPFDDEDCELIENPELLENQND